MDTRLWLLSHVLFISSFCRLLFHIYLMLNSIAQFITSTYFCLELHFYRFIIFLRTHCFTIVKIN